MDSLISCCGLDCSKCHLYKNMCEGCNACHGKVFHAPKGQACPIYECAVNKNGFESCTNCKDLPCLIWKNTRDPSLSDKEFENSILQRIKVLKND
ncbi:DUF3795 domain-containing protein [Succinivibrio sp.]|uniref:DUF3795 domain-containing protein n=1 Tax=Succinivibrio sp. TaxID=2053619 RepID=UPI003866F3BC